MNLTALQNSAFLQSLGWAIANSLWQAAVLWMAYGLVNGLYKNGSAKFKNNFSTILLLGAFVWFCVSLLLKYFALQNSIANTNTRLILINTISANTTAGSSWNAFLNKLSQALPYLSVAYLLLLVFLAAKLVNCYRFTNYLKTSGLQKPNVEWKMFTQKVALHLGITKKINLWISEHIDVPATIGFLKPVILIPLASVNQLSASQLEAIILHELSHIKRNDYLLNLFISLIETILFFNPFILLLSKIIKKERENCCDDFVIQYQYDRHSYASALLSLEQYRKTNLRFALSATSGKKQLLTRIKRIMEVSKSNANFNYGQKLFALLLITGIICSIAWLSPEKNNSGIAVMKNLPIQKTLNQKNKILKTRSSSKQNNKSAQNVIANSFIKNINSIIKNDIKKVGAEKTIAIDKEKSASVFTQQNNAPLNYQNAAQLYSAAANQFDDAPFNEKSSAEEQQDYNSKAPQIKAEKLLSVIKNNRSHFEYYFNMNKLQNDIKEQLENIQHQANTYNFNNNNFKGFESLINNTFKNFDEVKLNQQLQTYLKKIPQVKFKAAPRIMLDSISKLVMLNRRKKYSLPQPPAPPEIPELPKSKINIKNMPGGFSFHMNLDDNIKINKGIKKTSNNKLTIQYNNGVLIINGERIHLPDNKKLLAQLKAEKLIPSDGQNSSEAGTDD